MADSNVIAEVASGAVAEGSAELLAKFADLEERLQHPHCVNTPSRVDELLAEIAALLAKIADLEERLQYVHYAGISSTRDPSNPREFADLFEKLYSLIRTYMGIIMRNVTASNLQAEFGQLLATAAASFGHDEPSLINPILFRKAILTAVFVRELFNHFENDTFDNESMIKIMPAGLKEEYLNRCTIRKEFDAIMSMTIARVRDDDRISTWFRGVISRAKAALKINDMLWYQIFESKSNDTILHLWDIAKFTWALHRLGRTYARVPRILRIRPFDSVIPDVCKSKYGEENAGEEDFKLSVDDIVYCMVFPGYQYDNAIYSCDIVAADK
jgi:hypothetical protein